MRVNLDRLGNEYQEHGTRTATTSINGRYRFLLEIKIAEPCERTVLFIMLNPSTADAFNDDATIRRCTDFAQRWELERLAVVNLFAYRATDPRRLRREIDRTLSGPGPVGPRNDDYIDQEAKRAETIVCAWGNGGELDNGRGSSVLALLETNGHADKLCHLGLTKGGNPRHPLYLRKDAELCRFAGRMRS